ncbi:DUF1768-domain-containing protein [Heliocybe sulcata]|uniref:DUF1768-domain-containing protein n=1 Tax=Heliocybe sulcata TaxID=5364 RepID=A0A5C3N6S4_9AGAM|nr:DUF1768-domain-containing protein [Heliocybe sulcata]
MASDHNRNEEQRPQGPKSPPSSTRPTIRFYSRVKPYFEFSNFSDHPIRYNGKDYSTGEHLFQALKFLNDEDSENIRLQSSPEAAKRMAQTLSHRIREGWITRRINMDEVLMLKFTQHQDLRDKLFATGDTSLIEDSPEDPFWGTGADGRGRNELGKALERLRSVLTPYGGSISMSHIRHDV